MTKIRAEDRHTFAPSRPDGVVCVALRDWTDADGEPPADDDVEHCGYPAGHPIHGNAEQLGADVVARRNALRNDLQRLFELGRDNRGTEAAVLIEGIVNR